MPLRDLLAAQPKRLLLGMGTRFVEGFTFNLYSVYLLAYVVTNLELPKSVGPQRASWSAPFLGVVLVPITGALSDRFGRKPVFRVGAWAALLVRVPDRRAGPERDPHRRSSSRFVGGLGVLYGVIYGPLAAFWSELFDTRYRYTALSSLYQISGIVASGLTPLIAAWLVSRGGGSLWLVSVYASVVAVISLVSARLLPETVGRDLDEAWKPTRRDVPVESEERRDVADEIQRRFICDVSAGSRLSSVTSERNTAVAGAG